ncbi:MAG: FAD-binding oxidoreductase [Acidimicrobiia bacterium]|nr:FAD-binding oxidoreductase [Acidimicrobiia bacterium]
MATDHDLLQNLRSRLGTGAVMSGADAEAHLTDWRGVFTGSALAVVRPASTAEVAEAVLACADAGVALVPQGGNTGLSGGATPVAERPCVVLSLSRLRAIERIDRDGRTMMVQAGTTVGAVQDAARAAGLAFAPDWGARGTATVGGAIATDAGGVNVLRHGNMRAHVLGLEVVLADGRVWNGLRELRKDSSGYDLKQLFIGSEGTLGVVTRAVLSLEAARSTAATGLAALRDLDALGPLLTLARRAAADSLVAFELIPRLGVERVAERFEIPIPLTLTTEYAVLIKLAANESVDERLARIVADAVDAGIAIDGVVAATAEQEDRLWTIRDELPIYRLFEHQAIALKNDTAVPVGRIAEFLEQVTSLVDRTAPGALTYAFGHAGDGNLHVAVLPDDGSPVDDFLAARDELRAAIDELTFEFGGTLSAEHGIGRDLRERIVPQKPVVEWELMRTIKSALDPTGVMNPGAIFREDGHR